MSLPHGARCYNPTVPSERFHRFSLHLTDTEVNVIIIHQAEIGR